MKHGMWAKAAAAGALGIASAGVIAQGASQTIKVDWSKAILTSKTTPTLQVVVNPELLRGAKLHDPAFAALKLLGADYVRYVPWLPYPKQAVAELDPPTKDKTSWDFQYIDPTLVYEGDRGALGDAELQHHAGVAVEDG